MGQKKIEGKRIGEILETWFTRAGWGERMIEGKAIGCWPEAVGKEIAEKTQPFRIRAGVLHVRVPNSVWMQELHFFKNLILQKLNHRLKQRNPQASPLKDLKFFIGERELGALSRVQSRVEPQVRELTWADKERIQNAVVFIKDKDLREVFQRFLSRGLQTDKSKTKSEK